MPTPNELDRRTASECSPDDAPGQTPEMLVSEVRAAALRVKRMEQIARDLSRLSVLLRTLDIDKVLDRITQRAVAAFGAHRCMLCVHDESREPSGWRTRSVRCRNETSPGPHINAAVDEAISTGTPVVLKHRGACRGASEGCEHGCVVLPLYLYHEALPPPQDETISSLLCLCGIEDEESLADETLEYKTSLFSDTVSVSIANALAYRTTAQLAYEDSLTRVKTRRVFDDLLAKEWQRYVRHKSVFSVALLDVDKLKTINDTYGHEAGDEVLRWVAQVADRQSRLSDIVVRYGGDEFAILLPETDAEGGQVLISRILDEMKTATSLLMPLHVGLSAGVASSRGRESEAEVLRGADAALYRAKRSGGGSVCVDPPPESAKTSPPHVPPQEGLSPR